MTANLRMSALQVSRAYNLFAGSMSFARTLLQMRAHTFQKKSCINYLKRNREIFFTFTQPIKLTTIRTLKVLAFSAVVLAAFCFGKFAGTPDNNELQSAK